MTGIFISYHQQAENVLKSPRYLLLWDWVVSVNACSVRVRYILVWRLWLFLMSCLSFRLVCQSLNVIVTVTLLGWITLYPLRCLRLSHISLCRNMSKYTLSDKISSDKNCRNFDLVQKILSDKVSLIHQRGIFITVFRATFLADVEFHPSPGKPHSKTIS